MKKINKNNFKVFNQLIGKKFNNIFSQLNMFIINFGDNIEYSFHVFTLLRIRDKNGILFMSNDKYVSKDYQYIESDIYENDEFHLLSLQNETISRVNEILKKSSVKNVYKSVCGDIRIRFDNDLLLETIIDSRVNDECYHLICFKPNFVERDEIDSKDKGFHLVVRFYNGQLISEIFPR